MTYHWWLSQTQTNGYAFASNVFTLEEIEQIKQIGENSNLTIEEDPRVGAEKIKDDDYRTCKLNFIKSDIKSNEWIFRKLTDVIFEINRQYFNFDLDYIQSLQFTEYDIGGKYGKHTDVSTYSERPRKLSFILQLSDATDYEGGDFKLYYSDEPYIADKKIGTLLAFPSYALHEVIPVTQGKRYSLVGWVCGPAFK